jgi:hypothetical protein
MYKLFVPSRDVAFGSKPERLKLSKCDPLSAEADIAHL